MKILTLFFIIVFGGGIFYFATQNTSTVTIHIGQQTWPDIPLYTIVLLSVIVGLVIAWLFHLLTILSDTLTLSEKEQEGEKASYEKTNLVIKDRANFLIDKST